MTGFLGGFAFVAEREPSTDLTIPATARSPIVGHPSFAIRDS
jgi:hypothetical protein